MTARDPACGILGHVLTVLLLLLLYKYITQANHGKHQTQLEGHSTKPSTGILQNF